MFNPRKPMPTIKGQANAVTAVVTAGQPTGLEFDLLTEYEGITMSTPIKVTFDPSVGTALNGTASGARVLI